VQAAVPINATKNAEFDNENFTEALPKLRNLPNYCAELSILTANSRKWQCKIRQQLKKSIPRIMERDRNPLGENPAGFLLWKKKRVLVIMVKPVITYINICYHHNKRARYAALQ